MEAAATAEGAPIEPRKPKKPADGGPPRVSEERRAANESRRRLARLRASGEADVTSTRVAVDARESERREEASRGARRSGAPRWRGGGFRARDAEVEQSWSRIFADATVPTELRDALEAQRKACDEVIAAKDAMADEIREELKLRDEGHVKALKRQAEDVDAPWRRCARGSGS